MVRDNSNGYYKDFLSVEKKLSESNAKYKGEVIDFLYQPNFFDKEDIAGFNGLVSILTGILDRVIKEYLENPEFRKYFGFSPLMEELILVDPGYKRNVPIARFDIFNPRGDNFKFCELNGDGTSAMNETNTLEDILLESEIIKEIQREYNVGHYELFDSWIDEILTFYREYGGENTPNVAIVDFEEQGTTEEFKVFQTAFCARGFTTVIADPTHLEYKNSGLFLDNMRIDLVYRRAVSSELVNRADEVSDFLRAYRDGVVCVVGPFRSHVMHSKKIFAILCDEKKTRFLNEQQRAFIDRHIPYTAELTGDEELIDTVKEQKDSYVLKPMDLWAAKGVYIGRDCSPEKWEEKITYALAVGNYLLQEFCIPSEEKAVVFRDGKPQISAFKTILGLFVYNNKFKGLYTRAGKSNVIASIAGCWIMPSLTVE
ncbi:MAG: glutathionylspermidine synthase family protein [Spirochaetales bacterium]|nr:glutathionylspermidine synthase family protein [Spirochaetales bacterium]